MNWEKEDPLGKADAFLARFRQPAGVTATDEFPLLTDVVEAAECLDGNVQEIRLPHPGVVVPGTGQPVVEPPPARQPVPDISALVEQEVLRRLEKLLPDIAAQAGRIAQEILETRLHTTDTPDHIVDCEPDLADSQAGKPPQV